MNTVLSIYSQNAFKEYLLPTIVDEEYLIVVDHEIFGLSEDVILKLESLEYQWSFMKSEDYSVEAKNGEQYEKIPLKHDDFIKVLLKNGEIFYIMVDQTETTFAVFEKFDIRDGKPMVIGCAEGNDICYNRQKLISYIHASIKKQGEQYIAAVEHTDSNGFFVNFRRVTHSRQLFFGDHINIYGLDIIFLDGILAIKTADKNVIINRERFKLVQPDVMEGTSRQKRISDKRVFFHRSPRQLYKLSDDVVEIETPPTPGKLGKKPLGMLIGPSMTMALPMMLGCGLAIYSTKVNGNSGSAFMYTGLVTAITSALVGASWTIINLNYEKKKSREEELHRFEAYGEYLIKCTNLIKDKYEKNTANMRKTYLSAEECCNFDENTLQLWNRNVEHKDFLTHRLGIGDLPFQVTINVPKERFTMIDDSLAEKPGLIKESYKTLYNVPVCINLLEHHIVGVIGGARKKGAIEILYDLVAQIASANCYTDVKMAFLYDEEKDESSKWEYLKWFPHTWSEDKKTRFMAKNKAEAGDVLYEITKVMRERAEQRKSYERKKKLDCPQYILFVSEQELLKGELITNYVYDQEKDYGLTTVFLVENYEELPNACEYIIQNDAGFQGMYRMDDDVEERLRIRFDMLPDMQLERFARKLSSIEVNEEETGGDVPSSLSFFEMYGVNSLEELDVAERWRKNRTYDSMKVLIGAKAGGVPWYLDIHEKYHGPHGLIAGTTGSGKSEILQTYILSLALNFSPDDVGFFIIDYKGGGMANLFDGLPHMLGQISNLSGNQVKRAMIAIKSENRRRQRVFNEYGVNNINLYTKLYKNREASIAIPHLFIIIDEFAELKREEPDFMRELISVAQVGRSLGVHLILATQKPSGTVDDNIWSNAKFRLCLRVQDKQDSNDMLHKPDAAYITQAGRCYMQVGNDELFELFQSGWSGAVYDEENERQKNEIVNMISATGKAALVGNRTKIKRKEKNKLGWIEKLVSLLDKIKDQLTEENVSDFVIAEYFDLLEKNGVDYPYGEYNAQRIKDLIKLFKEVRGRYPAETDLRKVAEVVLSDAVKRNIKLPEKKEKTQLNAVVSYLEQMAKAGGYVHSSQLWRPILPTNLYLDQLDSWKEVFDGNGWNGAVNLWDVEVPVGLYDDPENQVQDTFYVNLSQNGHHAIIGTVVSGKSTFLQTLLYALTMKYTPQSLNIYAIDYSSKMLSAFETMPHVGGIIYENEDEKIARFFNMMKGILTERKRLLKGGNYIQYVQGNGVVIPAIALVIDNYAAFRAKTSDRFENIVLQLVKDGVGYGIYLIVTAGGFGAAEIPTRMGDNFRTVISLEMNDRYQYMDIMRTPHLTTLPEMNVKGRGIARIGEGILEFQTALPFVAEDDFERVESIQELGNHMCEIWNGEFARTIPEIPEKPVWEDYLRLKEVEDMLEDDRHLPIGYDFENADAYGVDLSRTFCYLISGKSGSGKTNLLKILLRTACRKKGTLALIDFDGECSNQADKVQAAYIDTDEKLFNFFNDLIPDFVARRNYKKERSKSGSSEEELYADMQRFNPVFIFISNLKDFVKHVTAPEKVGSMLGFVQNMLEKGKAHNVYLFAVINQEDVSRVEGNEIYMGFRKYKTGAYFGGNVSEQRIFNFDHIPYSEQRKPLKRGIAMLPYSEEESISKIAIPLCKD